MLFYFFAAFICLNIFGGQMFSNGQNTKQEKGFPLLVPEQGINPNVNERAIADAVQMFAQDISVSLWKKQILGNVVFSPLSIQAILGVLLLGSRGVTYEQLHKALFFPANVTDKTIHESFQYVLGLLEGKSNGVEIDLANALFVQSGILISPTYNQIAQALYDVNVVDVNFKNRPLKSTRQVNQFVRTATRGKVPQILQSPLSSDTLMVAVNTIYFNGPWQFPFNKDDTKLGLFDTGTKKKNVEMMNNMVTVPFIKRSDLGFEMVSLPYLDSHLSLYILTPVGTAGISSLINLEGGLALISLENLINDMKSTSVQLVIPKIKLKFRHNFKSYLEGLGVTTLFDGSRSNFGRMTSYDGFSVKDVVHEAVMEITETGTIAAAATVTTINRIKSAYFRVDKPSLLFIRDNSNGVILFWARVVDP